LFAAFNPAGASAGAPYAALTADEQQMLELINRDRAAAGLQPFQVDIALSQIARQKTRDMPEGSYFAPWFPVHGFPDEMLKEVGLQYRYAGETYATAPSVETALGAIQGGRNVLSKKFDRIGIGITAGGSSRRFVLLFAGGGEAASLQLNPQPVPQQVIQPLPQQPRQKPAPSNDGLSAGEQQMLNLVNQERVAAGLQPLQVDMALVKLARLKAREMIDKGYFAHQSPTYGSPFEMIKAAGIEYRYAGENLAGASTVDSAHKNLMNSPGHRANILNDNYTKAGIGVVDGGPYGKMFVQLFTG